MAFAGNSNITINTGVKHIMEVQPGDTVMVWAADGIKPGQVSFSSGTGGGGPGTSMLFISFDDKQIIVSLDQPLMTAQKKLILAYNLKPWDQLLYADGKPAGVSATSVGMYSGEIHGVATDAPTNSMNGHLIIVNGIVCGDYVTEVYGMAEKGDRNAFTKVAETPIIPHSFPHLEE